MSQFSEVTPHFNIALSQCCYLPLDERYRARAAVRNFEGFQQFFAALKKVRMMYKKRFNIIGIERFCLQFCGRF